MRTEVKIDGGSAFFKGTTAEIIDFSAVEDATTIDPSNYNGGFGQLSVTATKVDRSKLAMGKTINLSDSDKGKTTGIIRQIGMNERVTFTGDSVLGLFNTFHTIGPQVGTLEQAFAAYCDLVGITNVLAVDESLADLPVQFPGFRGNVWDNIKRILVSMQIEISLVYDKVVVRPLRQVQANLARSAQFDENLNAQSAAKFIEIYYYPTATIVSGEVYPIPGEEANILQVDAGETREFTLPLKASLESINQPENVGFVENRPYDGTTGVYTVVANDGLPVTPAQWAAEDGHLSVRLGEDSQTVVVLIRGANNTEMAPFRIAMSSGSGNFYNALHLTGRGVRWSEEMLTLTTGATSEITGEDIGVTITNPFIQTCAQAYTAGIRASCTYAGLVYTVSGTALNINRRGGNRDQVQATFADYQFWWLTTHPGETQFLNFNAAWNTYDFAQFNAFWDARVADMFANQAFGNAAGARVRLPHAYFRIDTATITPRNITYSASLDTMIADYNAQYETPQTFADFNVERAGYTFSTFAITPLTGVTDG